MEKQRKTFLSYSRANKDFAVRLARELKSEGFWVWLDQLDIPAGARWDREVEKALKECEIFMIILTPASIDSENVLDEIGYAIDMGKRFLPVLLEKCDVPLRLRRFQYVDFTDKSFDEGVESAKELLRSLIDQPTFPRVQPSEGNQKQMAQAEAERKAREEADKLLRAQAAREATEKVAKEKAKKEATDRDAIRLKAEREAARSRSTKKYLFGIVIIALVLGGYITMKYFPSLSVDATLIPVTRQPPAATTIAPELPPYPDIATALQKAGNSQLILIANNFDSILLVDRTSKEILWQKAGFQGINCITPMPNGNILACDGDHIIEIDSQGNIVSSLGGIFGSVGDVKYLDNGLLLVSAYDTSGKEGEGMVMEVDWSGKISWLIKGLWSPSEAVRLSNGNTLVADGTGVLNEYNSSTQVVWSAGLSQWAAAVQRLPNGQTIVGEADGVEMLDASGNVLWSQKGWGRITSVRQINTNEFLVNDSDNNKVIIITEGGEILWEMTGLNFPQAAMPYPFMATTAPLDVDTVRILSISPRIDTVLRSSQSFDVDMHLYYKLVSADSALLVAYLEQFSQGNRCTINDHRTIASADYLPITKGEGEVSIRLTYSANQFSSDFGTDGYVGPNVSFWAGFDDQSRVIVIQEGFWNYEDYCYRFAP